MSIFRHMPALAALITLLNQGCYNERSSAPILKPSAPALRGLPVEMVVPQRSTTDVPGSGGAVRLTIDDVTRGQVTASLAGKDGRVLLAATSLSEGESAAFTYVEGTYYLVLDNLENEMVGDDSATLTITATPPPDEPAANPPVAMPNEGQEREKIEQLIEHVASLEGAVFIRNGQEHAAPEAAAHLRRKWDAAADEIATAEQFIERMATRSSLSGKPYRIRLADGAEMPSAEYLRKRLAEME